MKTALGRRWLSLLLTCVLCLSLAPAAWAEDPPSGGGTTPPALTGITLSFKEEPPGEVMEDGQLPDLTVEAKSVPDGADLTGITYTWSSSDSGVITVKVNGATASLEIKGVGEATISVLAECGTINNTVERKIKVKANTPTQPQSELTLNKTTLSLKVGESKTLTATYTENGTTVSKPVTWTSSASSVATVDRNGRVEAVGEGTAKITAACEGETATCTVTVSPADVPNATVTINNKGPFTIDPNGTASVTVTPTPGTEEVKWKFVGETGDQDIDDTDIVSLSITGREPGELRMYAYVGDGSGANQRTDTITVTVSGIVVDTKPIELQENQILPLPEAKAYGTAASGAVKYVVSDGYIAQVVKGNSVKGYTPGSTAIIVSDQKNIYKVSIPLTVVNDPSTTIEYSRTLRSGEALSFKELSSDFRSQLGGKVVSVSGLSVPTDQGTLYYNYHSEAEPGWGVGSDIYYLGSEVTGGRRDLEDVTFVVKPTYMGGTVNISYVATTRDSEGTETYNCRITLKVEPETGASAGVSLTTKYNTPVRFNANEFNRVCKERTGMSLSYITFSHTPVREGTLYTDYVSEGSYGSLVSLYTQYSMRNLDNIWFVPAPGYTGNVTVYYTARSVGTPGATFSGQVNITVGTESGVAIGGVDYDLVKGGVAHFDDVDFNNFCRSKLDSYQTLSFIQFDSLPSASQGVLYYDYRSASVPGSRASAGTAYYYGTYSPRIDRLAFVPAEDFIGTLRIPFTGQTRDGTRFTGNVEINVRGGTGSGDIQYSCAQGKSVNFKERDFNELCKDLTDSSLNYIQLQDLPDQYSQGSVYRGSSRVTSTNTRYYYGSSSNRISNLSFRASSSFSGSVDIPFIGTNRDGDTFYGTITITSSGSTSSRDTIQYSTDYNSAAVFDRDDFDNLSQWETDRDISTVRFDLPRSSEGDLYRNYRSSSSKGTRITSSSTTISAGELDRVAFIPASRYTGTVTLDFVAKATNNEEFEGTVEITVERPGADVTVRYSTRISPVAFRGEDFKKNNTSLSSIQFTSMPPTSAGYVYYQYVSPTRYGRQANTSTTYRSSGSSLISDLTFVPRAGYTGTVTIPYTGTNSNGSTFEGEVQITVSPSYSSAYFSDMSGYSDAQRAAVDYLRENGITNGISATQYGPEYSITRADFAVMLYQTFGLTASGSSGYFNDVPSGAYYAQAVNTLRSMGIVSGIGNGAYGSSYTLSRQDAICMIQRTLRTMGWNANDGSSSYLNGYSDSGSVAGYAQGAMAHAIQMGYLPTANGRLAPRDPLTRVDMAQIVHRVLTY